MSALVPFSSDDFAVRTVVVDGEPWFVAADVCRALEIGNPSQAVSYLDDDEVTLTTDEGGRSLNIVSEPGLYSLVLRSRKPEAKVFKRWITHDVIPAIRKSGSYTPAPQFAIPRTYAEALMAAATLAVEGERKDARIAELEPAAAFTTELVAAAGDFDVRAAAQILNRDPNIRMGEGRLFAYLRGEGWIDRDNRPYQRHVDAGRLVERMRPWHNGKTGQSGVDHQARITVKGVRDLHGKLRGTAPIVFATQAELLPGHAS